MGTSLPPFEALDFGLADAAKERLREPRLLLEGYLDHNGSYESVVDGTAFLVLGYKGSGKSALAQHIQLRAASSPTTHVRIIRLDELPLSDFVDVIPGSRDTVCVFPRRGR